MKYIVFLRAVNVSGKNKVSMPDLKKIAEKTEFSEVQTYLNSGNIIVESEKAPSSISENFSDMLKEGFGVETENLVISREHLQDIMDHAPEWWLTENSSKYRNLILIMKGSSFDEIFSLIGEPSENLEKIENYKDAVFWEFDLKTYQKATWWKKTAAPEVNTKITVRTANTIRKILEKAK